MGAGAGAGVLLGAAGRWQTTTTTLGGQCSRNRKKGGRKKRGRRRERWLYGRERKERERKGFQKMQISTRKMADLPSPGQAKPI